ncbi:hypothetical protein EFL26_01455 [Nocardioides pocheonensis]|uniref:Uncharacterized protein n=1 Tax=Nocardioides pocheonensis TaxID=661485 RepID=A0A3N0GYJ5_9ACTN|nr:hypothetical protein EFL26_01455 [Nocardioides pocheonensis]
MDAEVGILGAGASGLSIVLLIDEDHVPIERSSRAGGHAQSTTSDGFTFDDHRLSLKAPLVRPAGAS